jgi:hypothetical protein
VKGLLTGIVLLFVSVAVNAQDLYMVRSQLAFPEAMAVLQETIREHGLTVSRVQRVDIGLTAFEHLRVIYSSASMQSRFDRWEENLRSILEEVRISD